MKRLGDTARGMSGPESRSLVALVKDFMQLISWDAARIPASDRIAPRPAKPGTLDLTSARLFIESHERHANLAAGIARCCPALSVNLPDGRSISFSMAIRVLLQHLCVMHGIWRVKFLLDLATIDKYADSVRTFGMVWEGLNWKSTVWVHWVVRHSLFYITKYRNMYRFSSIPTERRNVLFKRDRRHCFLGSGFESTPLAYGGTDPCCQYACFGC